VTKKRPGRPGPPGAQGNGSDVRRGTSRRGQGRPEIGEGAEGGSLRGALLQRGLVGDRVVRCGVVGGPGGRGRLFGDRALLRRRRRGGTARAGDDGAQALGQLRFSRELVVAFYDPGGPGDVGAVRLGLW